jgi:hypothetical protein
MEYRQYIFDADNGLRVICLRGEEPPTITDGYGGWQVVDRPRRVGYTQWEGVNPIKLKVPCLFDDWRDGQNIEADVGVLARMAQPDKDGEPPVLDVQGALPRRDIDRWVIESLEWGSNVIWGFDKKGVPVRFRQDVIVNLIQFIDPESLGAKKKKTGGGGRPKPKHKFHYVKKGETLSGISAREYGNAKWWRDIAKANNIRDPKKIRVGQRLRLP